MISGNDFDSEMRRLKTLTGKNFEGREQRDLTYEKLKNCNPLDFKRVCGDDDMIEEIGRYGLTYATIRKHLSRFRLSREAEEDRVENERIRRISSNNGNIVKSPEFQKMLKEVKSL